MRFQRRAEKVDAIQYRKGMSVAERVALLEMRLPGLTLFADGITIQAQRSAAMAKEGDWLVKDSAGQCSVVNAETFAKLYQRDIE